MTRSGFSFPASLGLTLKGLVRTLLRRTDPFLERERSTENARGSYRSQYGQDQLIHRELVGDLRGGVFVDIGAHDGVGFSNTYFFEKALGWSGLCVEPIPEVFEQLQRNRTARCVQGCVAGRDGRRSFLRVTGYAEMLSGMTDAYDPRHLDRIRSEVEESGGRTETIEVSCYRPTTLLEEHGIKKVDLLSVDVEGAELEILHAWDFGVARPIVVCIENNYRDRRVWRLLERRGYNPYARIRQDEIYVDSSVPISARIGA